MRERHTRPGGHRLSAAILLGALLALTPGAKAGAIDWSRAHTIKMFARDYRFVPNRLVLRRGVPYRLHLENRGEELHELTAPDFFKTVALGNPQVLRADGGDLAVAPGEQKDLYFVPLQRGRFRFICTDHDWAGMVGEIRIE